MRSLLLLSLLLPVFLCAQVNHWETVVYAEDDWRFRPGLVAPASSWKSLSYNDSNWQTGPGSIGYGDGDDNTVIAPVVSLYMRRKFTITDLSKIEAAVFHADFDDGFVAYLNGTEIARFNMEGASPTNQDSAIFAREAMLYRGGFPLTFPISQLNLADLLEEGENVLAIQTHNFNGLSSSDLTTAYWLSVGINDTSTDYGPTPEWFVGLNFSSELPIVKINTGGQPIIDEPEIDGTMGIIWNGEGNLNHPLDPSNEYSGNITVEKRGQTSLSLFPKNGYGIETKDENGDDEDVSFLGFPEEEDWILHGPYSDKTMLRNVLAMHMARSIGQYASRTRLVELFVNEQYEGVYVLMEKIKRDNNRVDIAKLNPDEISGDDLTGGYIFKIDKGEVNWESQYDIANNPGQKLKFQYVYPKASNIVEEQEAYIQSYVDSFENALAAPDLTFGGKRYDEYIDLTSFAEHFIISELTKNVDAYRISTFMYKDKDSNGGLIHAGPVWDFNLAFGNANYCEAFSPEVFLIYRDCDLGNPFWWRVMAEDEAFVNTVKCRWLELQQGPLTFDNLEAFIDEKAELLENAVIRNFQRWPVLGEYVWPNPVVNNTYAEEVDFMKDFLRDRIEWIDGNVFGDCAVVDVSDPQADFPELTVSPNPARESLLIEWTAEVGERYRLRLVDALGRTVWQQDTEAGSAGSLQLDLTDQRLPGGLYFLQLNSSGRWGKGVAVRLR